MSAVGAVAFPSILDAAACVARAAVPSQNCPAEPDGFVLAREEVLELILFVYAVGLQLLHADYRGLSRQKLAQGISSSSSSQPSARASSAASSQRASSSSSSKGSRGNGTSGSSSSTAISNMHVPVPPHHQELLHSLIGVRQVDVSQYKPVADIVLANMSVIVAAVGDAVLTRIEDALGMSASSRRSDSEAEARRQAVRAGERLPWALAAAACLVQVEVLALMPSFLANNHAMLLGCVEDAARTIKQANTLVIRWSAQDQLQQPDQPSLDTLQTQAQSFLQSPWLQCGPVLLSVCTSGATDSNHVTPYKPALLPVELRGLFAPYASMLLAACCWEESKRDGVACVSLSAMLERDLLLCSKVVEASLHSLPAANRRIGSSGRPDVFDILSECHAAGLVAMSTAEAAVQVLAGATGPAPSPSSAASAAAMAGTAASSASATSATAASSQDNSALARQVFSQLVAALKYMKVCSAGNSKDAPLLWQKRLWMFDRLGYAALSMMGVDAWGQSAAADAGAGLPPPPPPQQQQQVMWFHLLGRSLVAASILLQQVALHVSADGCVDRTQTVFPQADQFESLGGCLRMLIVIAIRMHSMLQQGGRAAVAVAGGTAAATSVDLQLLQRQAADLQQHLMGLHKLFDPTDYNADGSWASGYQPGMVVAVLLPQHERSAMQQLRAACASGSLLQQLASFGVACCSAFPQPGVCGNPACINLDKFSEAALATLGCSGCGKAVKFCSAHCHKTAWKSGHKAACAVLKQQQERSAGAGVAEPAAAV